MPHNTKTIFKSRHICELDIEDAQELPKVAPFGSFWQKLMQSVRNWCVLSTWNPHVSMYFRSQSAFYKERRRQLTHSHFRHIIHPLSRIVMVRQIAMCILWSATFIADPFLQMHFTNYINDPEDRTIDLYVYMFITNILCGLEIFLNFFTGYVVDRKQIMLNHASIIKRYLRTYFIFDFLPVLYWFIMYHCTNYAYSDRTCNYISVPQLYALRFTRIYSLRNYVYNILSIMKIPESAIMCIVLLGNTLYVIHWMTCLLFLVPSISYYIYQDTYNSWVLKNMIETERSLLNIYIECLLSTICHFFGAGRSTIDNPNGIERMILSCVLMGGVGCHIYIIALILQVFGTISISESKYEELIYQLNDYMVTQKIPTDLRKRLVMYYEYRFQKQYFNEAMLLSTLSEHLRHEVILYSCSNLIEKVRLFRGATKHVIGTIISMLQHEIFLPDDQVLTCERFNECVYFISFGTVMITSASGKEMRHLEDGHHFGEIRMILSKEGYTKSIVNVTAIEITEVFYLTMKDFMFVFQNHPDIAARLENVARNRIREYLGHDDDSLEQVDAIDIITELRKGRILEHGRRWEDKNS